MSEQREREIAERLKAATPGPKYATYESWDKDAEVDKNIWTVSDSPTETGWTNDSNTRGYGLLKGDAELYAHAPSDLAWLLSELKKESPIPLRRGREGREGGQAMKKTRTSTYVDRRGNVLKLCFTDKMRLDWVLQRDLGVRDDNNIGGVLWLDTRRGIDAAIQQEQRGRGRKG